MGNRKSERQKVILFLILLIVLVGVWSGTLLKRRARFVPASSREEKVHTEGKGVPSFGGLRNLQKARMKQAWGRTPFLAIGEDREASLSGFSLTGILWDEKKPFAVINGVVVGVNDVIESYSIRRILSDAVVLEREGEEYILRPGGK